MKNKSKFSLLKKSELFSCLYFLLMYNHNCLPMTNYNYKIILQQIHPKGWTLEYWNLPEFLWHFTRHHLYQLAT